MFLHAAFFALSFLFILLFSYTTSFRYEFIGGDSAVFQCVAKYWLEGVIPYKELFDHKGPLIYLIDALGWAIQPRSGIMIPQIISLHVTFALIWRMLSMHWRGAIKIVLFVLTLIFLTWFYSNNMTEEFNLPFIAASSYCFMLFLKNSTVPPLHGLIYGLSFGASILLRTTNSMPVCCFAFLTAIFLIKDKNFKALTQNILSFLAGFAIIVLPFAIYFAANGALYDAVYGTILFNIHYAVDGSLHKNTSFYVVMSAVNFMPLIVMIIAAGIALSIDRKNKSAWVGLFTGAMLLIMLLSLRSYKHYALIIVPVLPFIFLVLNNAVNIITDRLKEIWRAPGFSFKRMIICKTLMPFFMLTLILYAGFCFKTYVGAFWFPFSNELAEQERDFLKVRAEIDSLKKIIPDAEKNSFMTWGLSEHIAHWILETDIKPRDRFFYNQTALSLMDPIVRAEWFAKVEENYPLWILYGGEFKKESPLILFPIKDEEVERLLAEKYIYKGEVSMEVQTLKLYRLKD